jgi:hypothetical protein
MSNRILLIDLAERELKARAKRQSEIDRLEASLKEAKPDDLSHFTAWERLAVLKESLNKDDPLDRLYRAVAEQVAKQPKILSRDSDKYLVKYGLLSSQQDIDAIPGCLDDDEQELAGTCGLLELDNLTDINNKRFISSVSKAWGDYRENIELFKRTFSFFNERFIVSLRSQIEQGSVSTSIIGCIVPNNRINDEDRQVPTLDEKGKIDPEFVGNVDNVPNLDDDVSVISARNIAAIVMRLAKDGVSAQDPWLSSKIESAFNRLSGVTEGAPPSSLEIALPELEESVDIDIQKENLHAIQAIYFSYQLEEMRLFQVVERIVELFRQGLLPLSRGGVGDYLFSYYKKAAERITESERRDLYFRAFGAPGGNPGMTEPNRDFNELWLRFVSSVSSFSRQLTVDRMLRSNIPMAVSQEQVRKAGRDLGANMSRNGYGIAYFAATDLQTSITEFIDVLQNAELRNVFGARDMWQVVDIVNANYLGGARNTQRYRTQAKAGAVIIRWIANNVNRLSNVVGNVLDTAAILNASTTGIESGRNATIDPTDLDLVNACEQWLAVAGVQDQSIEQYAQPIESPITSSRPIGMPQMARDALDAVGINLPA